MGYLQYSFLRPRRGFVFDVTFLCMIVDFQSVKMNSLGTYAHSMKFFTSRNSVVPFFPLGRNLYLETCGPEFVIQTGTILVWSHHEP
jgi:hypothetical protein